MRVQFEVSNSIKTTRYQREKNTSADHSGRHGRGRFAPSRLQKPLPAKAGLGIISSACIDRLVSKRNGKKLNIYEAVYEEISLSKIKNGFAGINIMAALVRDYNDSVKGALDAGADAIISGAGLPLNLPAIQPPKDTALIPIVSSARALEIICKKWEKLGYRPDAVVLEGPLAGGHLGFRIDQVELGVEQA